MVRKSLKKRKKTRLAKRMKVMEKLMINKYAVLLFSFKNICTPRVSKRKLTGLMNSMNSWIQLSISISKLVL
jgi:hypothetical protein